MEPFGPQQEDLRAGVVASWAAASCGASVRPDELFPSLRPPSRPPDPEGWRRSLAMVKAIAAEEAR